MAKIAWATGPSCSTSQAIEPRTLVTAQAVEARDRRSVGRPLSRAAASSGASSASVMDSRVAASRLSAVALVENGAGQASPAVAWLGVEQRLGDPGAA